MSRIPIIISPAAGSVLLEDVTYDFSWNSTDKQLEITDDQTDVVQAIKFDGMLTGDDIVDEVVLENMSAASSNSVAKAIALLSGRLDSHETLLSAHSDAILEKQDKMTAGNSISITKDENTGETVISYTGESGGGGLTEEQIRTIASEQAEAKIAEGGFAKAEDIPKNISDLTNDSGFVKNSELSPIATSGSYNDLADTPDPYDDSALQATIATLEAKIAELEEKTSGIDEALTVSDLYGQLTPGKTYPPGTTLEDIVKDIIDPAVPPTITEPSLSISGTDTDTTIASGSSLNATITLTFNRGTISTGGNTVGEATGYSLNGGAYQTSNVFNVTVTESNKTFKGKVRYGAGDQPKDSKGADIGTPRSAGEIESGTIEYNFAVPVATGTLWSNAANINSIVAETGVSKSDGEHVWSWCPQTETEPEIFDVPASWTVKTIETINDLNGRWESVSHNFAVSDTMHDGIAYKRYTDIREFDDDGRDIKITWE